MLHPPQHHMYHQHESHESDHENHHDSSIHGSVPELSSPKKRKLVHSNSSEEGPTTLELPPTTNSTTTIHSSNHADSHHYSSTTYALSPMRPSSSGMNGRPRSSSNEEMMISPSHMSSTFLNGLHNSNHGIPPKSPSNALDLNSHSNRLKKSGSRENVNGLLNIPPPHPLYQAASIPPVPNPFQANPTNNNHSSSSARHASPSHPFTAISASPTDFLSHRPLSRSSSPSTFHIPGGSPVSTSKWHNALSPFGLDHGGHHSNSNTRMASPLPLAHDFSHSHLHPHLSSAHRSPSPMQQSPSPSHFHYESKIPSFHNSKRGSENDLFSMDDEERSGSVSRHSRNSSMSQPFDSPPPVAIAVAVPISAKVPIAIVPSSSSIHSALTSHNMTKKSMSTRLSSGIRKPTTKMESENYRRSTHEMEEDEDEHIEQIEDDYHPATCSECDENLECFLPCCRPIHSSVPRLATAIPVNGNTPSRTGSGLRHSFPGNGTPVLATQVPVPHGVTAPQQAKVLTTAPSLHRPHHPHAHQHQRLTKSHSLASLAPTTATPLPMPSAVAVAVSLKKSPSTSLELNGPRSGVAAASASSIGSPTRGGGRTIRGGRGGGRGGRGGGGSSVSVAAAATTATIVANSSPSPPSPRTQNSISPTVTISTSGSNSPNIPPIAQRSPLKRPIDATYSSPSSFKPMSGSGSHMASIVAGTPVAATVSSGGVREAVIMAHPVSGPHSHARPATIAVAVSSKSSKGRASNNSTPTTHGSSSPPVQASSRPRQSSLESEQSVGESIGAVHTTALHFRPPSPSSPIPSQLNDSAYAHFHSYPSTFESATYHAAAEQFTSEFNHYRDEQEQHQHEHHDLAHTSYGHDDGSVSTAHFFTDDDASSTTPAASNNLPETPKTQAISLMMKDAHVGGGGGGGGSVREHDGEDPYFALGHSTSHLYTGASLIGRGSLGGLDWGSATAGGSSKLFHGSSNFSTASTDNSTATSSTATDHSHSPPFRSQLPPMPPHPRGSSHASMNSSNASAVHSPLFFPTKPLDPYAMDHMLEMDL